MDVYQKLDAQVRKFTKVYPRERPARLRWWGEVLGFDRVKLLRLLGLSPTQAARRQDEDLESIVADPETEVRAIDLEWMLGELLSFFHYDWHAFADFIRAPVREGVEDPPSPRNGEVKHRKDTSAEIEHLIYRLREPGPGWITVLLACLRAILADS